MNEYFNNTSNPQPNSSGSSSLIRAEFASIKAGFDKLPTIAGNGGEFVRINAGATALETTGDVVASLTVAATGKTTPVDADLVPLVDSEASNVLKKLTWANLKATLKTYFDSVTTTLTNKTIALGSNTVSGTLAQFNTAMTDGDFATLAGTETLTNKTLTSPDINGGTIDGTAIGSTTPAAGSFTTLNVSGGVTNTAGRSNFSSNDAYAIGAKNTDGGPVYFGATDATASPGGHIAYAGGSSIMSWTYAGVVTVAGGIAQGSVIAPTLLNSWVNYGAGYSSAGYWKDTLGIVHLQGMLKDGTIGANAFVLPSGYRPSEQLRIPVVSNSLFGWVVIGTDGSINPTYGNNAFFCLDGITFRAA